MESKDTVELIKEKFKQMTGKEFDITIPRDSLVFHYLMEGFKIGIQHQKDKVKSIKLVEADKAAKILYPELGYDEGFYCDMPKLFEQPAFKQGIVWLLEKLIKM